VEQLGHLPIALDRRKGNFSLEFWTELLSFVLHFSSPESCIEPGGEFTLTSDPVFGKYYNYPS